MAHVRSVTDSIAFYRKLGFDVGGDFVPQGPDAPQAVLFYLYCDGRGRELEKAGIPVGAITYPFCAPRGEFRIHDPDGYVLMVTHTEETRQS